MSELERLRRRVAELEEGLRWALKEGGWRLWYDARTPPPPAIEVPKRVGETADIRPIEMASPRRDRREVCKRCLRTNPLGFTVPDEVWNTVVPERYRNRVLCILCFDEFATAAGIAWEKEIQFWPVSGVRARQF